eukprot:2721240-Pyramimonas_sp.AAC.2
MTRASTMWRTSPRTKLARGQSRGRGTDMVHARMLSLVLFWPHALLSASRAWRAPMFTISQYLLATLLTSINHRRLGDVR